jgi:hypothetical protein
VIESDLEPHLHRIDALNLFGGDMVPMDERDVVVARAFADPDLVAWNFTMEVTDGLC